LFASNGGRGMGKKRWNLLLNILCGVVLLILTALLVVLILIKQVPQGFVDYASRSPSEVPREVAEASNRFTEKIMDVEDSKSPRRQIEITEDEINGYLRYGFESRSEFIPDWLQSPQVRIDGLIILQARSKNRGPIQPVLSVTLAPVPAKKGMGCRVAALKLGGLSIPRFFVGRYAGYFESHRIKLRNYGVEVQEGKITLSPLKREKNNE